MTDEVTALEVSRHSPEQLAIAVTMIANSADLSASERYGLHEAANTLRSQAARIAELEAVLSS